MSDLPPGWAWATLEDLAAPEPGAITDGPFGSNLRSEHYTDSGARVIRLQNIGDGEFCDDDQAYILLEHFESLRKHEIRAGDMAFASLGNSPPRVCILPTLKEPAIVKADCIRVRIHPQLSTGYVLSVLTAEQTRARVRQLLKGVGRPRLGLEQIRSIPVPLPPISEQHRIAAAVELHLAGLDRAMDHIRVPESRLAHLDESALRSMLGTECSEELMINLLRRRPSNGRSVPTAIEGFPVLRLTALHHGKVNLAERKVGAWTAEQAGPYLVRKGDVLLSRGNGSIKLVGRAALVIDEPDPVAYPDTVVRLAPDESKLDSRYLVATWNSHVVRDQIESAARTTAGIHKINQKIIEQVRLPLPPLQRQREIAERLGEERDASSRLCIALGHARERAASLRRSLLSAAFRGELADQDPSHEPADVLLARIRAERDAAAPRRKPRTRKVAAQ